jgi:HSP20 family protein
MSPWNWFNKERGGEKIPINYKSSISPAPAQELHNEIDQVIDNFFNGNNWSDLNELSNPIARNSGFMPQLNIRELEDAYQIDVEIPGVEKQDIKVELHDDTLMIMGEKAMESDDIEGNYHRIERLYGAFQRTLSLPLNTDKESIKADFKNGVLSLSIAKDGSVGELAREIEIEQPVS